jgi:hypothetical protein
MRVLDIRHQGVNPRAPTSEQDRLLAYSRESIRQTT